MSILGLLHKVPDDEQLRDLVSIDSRYELRDYVVSFVRGGRGRLFNWAKSYFSAPKRETEISEGGDSNDYLFIVTINRIKKTFLKNEEF